MEQVKVEPGRRLTRQRKIILEELKKVTSHPTADELFAMVRVRMPRISLGTVYRNLEVLSQEGLVRILDTGDTRKRFDGDISNHYHVRCIKCGKVDDVKMKQDIDLRKYVHDVMNYKMLNYSLVYEGICPDCLKPGH